MTKAIMLCADLAGFENDKDLCRALDIDQPVWARIKSGQAHFPHEKLTDLFDEAGNEVPMWWLLMRRGYDPHTLRKLQSETEIQLERERSAREQAESKVKYLESLITGSGQ